MILKVCLKPQGIGGTNYRTLVYYTGPSDFGVSYCQPLATVHKPLSNQTVRVWRRPSEFDMTKSHIALYSPTSLSKILID